MARAKKQIRYQTTKTTNKYGRSVTYKYKIENGVRTRVQTLKELRTNLKKQIKIIQNGKVNEKALAKLTKNASLTEKENIKSILKDLKDTGTKNISLKKFEAKVATDSVDKAFINAGFSSKEAAAQLGISEDVLKDPKNWKNGIFTAPNGKQYEINYHYDGTSAFIQVNKQND